MNSLNRLWALGLTMMVVVTSSLTNESQAQAWIEAEVLNQNNSLSWSYPVLFPNASLLLTPDPELGDVSWDVNGNQLTITFEPVPGAVGTAEFIVEHFSGNLPPQQVTKSYRIAIDSSHVLANEDYIAVDAGVQDVSLQVLANDELIGGTTLTIHDVLVAPEGTYTVSPAGDEISFTPSPEFSGMTYMSYLACDEYGACDLADVNICVVPSDGISLTDTLFYSSSNKQDLFIYLPAGGFELTSEPNSGEATEVTLETWKYDAFDDFSGIDTFTLQADTLVRVVIVDVFNGAGQNSYAVDDEYYTRVDSTITFDVRDNDLKVFPIHNYSAPDHGELTIDEFGVFTYVPELGYVGAVEFSYAVKPLNGYETATVVLYVGDMPPKNIEIYNLVTPINTPLLINYEIPLEDYDIVLTTDDEQHGEVTLYTGFRENVQVGCDLVSGYDMVVYTPELNYEGTDQFRLEYCVNDQPECTEFWINVEVRAFDELDDCYCQENCVWPGDADANGVVDMKDLLVLGKHIGETGAARNYPNNSAWHAQYAEDWDMTDEITGKNAKYIDSDGDGIISELDTLAIYDHYLAKHDIIPAATGLKADYQLTIVAPEGPVDSGDIAVFQIELGTENSPVIDLEGLHFTLNLPESIYEPGTVEIFFDDDSWITHDAPSLEMHMEPYPGRLDVGFSRVNGSPASGVGSILTMTFIVVDDIDGFFPPGTQIPFSIEATNIGGLGSDGRFREIEDADATLVYMSGGAFDLRSPISIDDQLFVFPNPASGNTLRAHLNGDREIETVEVFNMSGQMLTSRDIHDKRAQISIGDLSNGMYVLRVVATDGVITRPFEVVR